MRRKIPRQHPTPMPWTAPVEGASWRPSTQPGPAVGRPVAPGPVYGRPPAAGGPLHPDRPPVPSPPTKRRRRRLVVRLMTALLIVQLVAVAFIGSLRWWAAPRTAF